MLVYLRDKIRRSGKTTFSREELSQILTLYGARVQGGLWKDYAIDSLSDSALFSIFRSTHELPLYTIVKNNSGRADAQFSAYAGHKPLCQNTSLKSVIEALETQG